MILTCPSCETRYNVPDEAVSDAAGRQVRCANCGYAWHFASVLQETLPVEPRRTAEAAAQLTAPLTVTRVAPAAAPAGPDGAAPLDLGSAAAPALRKRPREGAGIGVVLGVVAALLVLLLIRNTIVEIWPETATVYNAVGLKTSRPEAWLDVKLTGTRTGDSFLVEGDITNTADTAHAVPRLRVVLRDASGAELDSKIIDPPSAQLQPAEASHFSTRFAQPSITASEAEVSFVSE